MPSTYSPDPSTYLQSLESKSKALKNFVEVPPSPPSVSWTDDDGHPEDRVAKLQDLVKQAYAHADGNTASGKWSAIPRLLRLGVTSGQRGRWIGARADLKTPTLRPGMEYIIAETEEEWSAWEKKAAVKDRVEVWKEGVLTPSGEGEVSALSIASKASMTTSTSDAVTKSGNALGFTVSKRSRQAIGKPKPDGKIAERAPSPPFVFPESQIMTSTPIVKPIGPHDAESYPASHPVHSLAPDANDTPSIHYIDEPGSHSRGNPLSPPSQHALRTTENEQQQSPAAQEADAEPTESPYTPVQHSVPLPLPNPVHTTPLKNAWSLPIPRPAQPSTSKLLVKRDRQPLNENGKRNFLQESPLPAPTSTRKPIREASASSKKSRVASSPSPVLRPATEAPTVVEPSTPRRITANVPTLTELLASSPRKKSSKAKSKKMVPITSIFATSAKGKEAEAGVGEATIASRAETPTKPARSSNPPTAKSVVGTSAFNFGLADDDVPPVDLGSPTKSLSSIADSDSDEDEVDPFDKQGLDISEDEDEGRGEGSPKPSSPFAFKPLATSTQKKDIPFNFEPVVTSTQKQTEAPLSSSQGIPVFNSQSMYQLDIARKVEAANRILEKDLGLLSSEDKAPGQDEGVDEEKAFEREMSGWVRGDSVDSD